MIFSKSRKILGMITLTVVIGLLVLVFGLQKTITLSIDGVEEKITTRALTVRGALNAASIQLSPEDNVSPEMKHILTNGDKIIIDHARLIYLLRDGKYDTYLTSEDDLLMILSQSNIPVDEKDQILINGRISTLTSILSPGISPIIVQINTAVPLKVTSEAGEEIIFTSSNTVIDALWRAGIIIESTDLLSLPPETILTKNLDVTISKGQPIHIKTNSGNFTIYSTASNVGEALTQAGFSLQGLDYSIPSADMPIPKNGNIQLIRMREEMIIEQTPVEFETEYQPVEDLELDTRSTIQPGEYGLRAQRVRVTYRDGIEVSRFTEDEWVVMEPKPRIVGYGTKIVKRVADTPDGPIEYWRALSMYAVSYHPVNDNYGTASGLPLKKGIVAIDRNYIPFYTRLYIPGYGEAIAADVGGGVRGRMIDLGYTNEDYVPWHQWVTVYFLWPPPDYIVWFIP